MELHMSLRKKVCDLQGQRPKPKIRLSQEILPSIPARKFRKLRYTLTLCAISSTGRWARLEKATSSTPWAFKFAKFSLEAKLPSKAACRGGRAKISFCRSIMVFGSVESAGLPSSIKQSKTSDDGPLTKQILWP